MEGQEKKLKLNREKCMIQRTQLTYVGHLLTAGGLQPDPEKIRDIQEMPEPTDKQAVMRFRVWFSIWQSLFQIYQRSVRHFEASLKVRPSGIGKIHRRRASNS